MSENARQVNQKQKAIEKKSTFQGLIFTSCGNPIASVYKSVCVDGKTLVRCVDTTNIHEFIQASKSSTDLATLQKRFMELGEIPVVDSTLTSVDTTVLPSDIHSLYNMVNDVNGNFNKLPESVRKVFGTAQDYLAAILDGSYSQKLADAFAPKNNNANETETKGEE